MRPSSLVLLSGGLDSTANLLLAVEHTDVQLTLTFNYGQRAATAELRQARAIADSLSIRHLSIDLPFLGKLGGSSLTSPDQTVPVSNEVRIDDLDVSKRTAHSVWVPNRNGLFLNVAGCFADRNQIDFVVPGFNAEEAKTFPDNSAEFLTALNQSFQFSTRHHVQVKCYTTEMLKPEIYSEVLRLSRKHPKFSVDLIWPCYLDGEKPCGQCESCQRFQRAAQSTQVLQ